MVVRRSTWLGGALVCAAMAIAACASIVGLEDAALDPTIGIEAGASSSGSSGEPADGGGSIEAAAPDGSAPCAGKDCPCAKSADCIDPIFSACEKGACHECSTSPDSCPADQYCQPSTLTCVPGCKGEDSCPGQHCSPLIHRCVDCVVQNDCKVANTKCTESGVCAQTCGGGTGCAGTETCCGDVCVDFKTDRNNCNGCGKKCTGAAPLCCNGTCVDTAVDEANCGKCGMACNTTQSTATCNSGTCTWSCNAGYTHCNVGNTGCDTRTDDNTAQCGGCAIDCNTRVSNATGKSCTSSACNYTSCNAGFTDKDGNRANGCEAVECGGLNQPCCTTGTACSGSGNVCDPKTNHCVACLGFHVGCDTSNDLCCRPNHCQSGPSFCN